MAAPVRRYKIVTLTEATHGFLGELITRAVQGGLLVPDELGYAADLWDGVRNAQLVVPPPPTPIDPPGAELQKDAADVTDDA